MDLPAGVIVLWSGAVGDIPAGFVQCNGSNGTPNLRARFVVGSGTAFPQGSTGGSVNHGHDFTGDGHTHNIIPGSDIEAGGDYALASSESNVTGSTDVRDFLPPYHSLHYIMKT